jgi:hypothetical protein
VIPFEIGQLKWNLNIIPLKYILLYFIKLILHTKHWPDMHYGRYLILVP